MKNKYPIDNSFDFLLHFMSCQRDVYQEMFVASFTNCLDLDPSSILNVQFFFSVSVNVGAMNAVHQSPGPITLYSPQRWDHFTALTRDKVFVLFGGGRNKKQK